MNGSHTKPVLALESTTEITVRRAEVSDAEALVRTCKRAFDSDSDVGAPGPGGPPGYDSVQWNSQRITSKYLQYYKILKEREIVGGFIAGDRGIGYQVCERIWVDPAYMRKGIGGKTFQLVWDMYPAADLWVLGTPEWNLRTNPFYRKVGFVQIGTTHEYRQWSGNYYERRTTRQFPRAMSRIEDLHKDQFSVVVEGLVGSLTSPRTVSSRKTGEQLELVDAEISDDTGSIRIVLWNDQIRQVEDQSSIRIENGYVREYNDELQLGIGKWGSIITLL